MSDALESLVGRMREQDKRQHLNSFAAYLIFTVLLGGGFFLLYQSRSNDLLRSRKAAVTERDAANQRVVELQTKLAARDAAAKAAAEYYALIRDKRRSEVIARFPAIDAEDLTETERELFRKSVQKARAEMVDAGYLAGIDAYRRGDYERAATELKNTLGLEVGGTQAALLRYYLGVSLSRLGRYDESVRQLELALAGDVRNAGVNDARYHMAVSFEGLESYEDARREFSKFAAANPKSPLAAPARRRAGELRWSLQRGVKPAKAVNMPQTAAIKSELPRDDAAENAGATTTPPEPNVATPTVP